MNWRRFEYKLDLASFPVRAMLTVFLFKEIVTKSIPLLDKGFGTPIIVMCFIQPAFAEKYY